MITRHGTISDFCLKVGDLSLLVMSLGLVIVFRFSPAQNPTFVVDYFSQRVKVTNAVLGVLLVLAWYAAFAAQGLYVSHRLTSASKELLEIARAIGICGLALLVAGQIGHWPTISLRTIAGFTLMSFLVIASVRLALRYNLRRLRERGHNVKSLVIVGAGMRGRRFAAHIKRRHDLGYKIIGYVDSDAAYAGQNVDRLQNNRLRRQRCCVRGSKC